MASTPATNTAAPAASFKPFFQRISQGDDRHADVLACCAMLCNKSLADIFKQAETLGLPKVGPYWLYADGDFIARLLAAHGLVATVWKEAKSYNDLSEVSLALVSYDESYEVGRAVIYHRNTSADAKTAQPYVVDPYPHTDSKLHVRMGTAALAELPPSWYIGVTQMNKTAGK
ncbi:hypothetical protein [Diaphorobacter sp. J5-51]|uniref:hypothetical protein n=2 Tax=Diaphorobacter TaxID=238749 RepID=UPI0012FA2D18|nr:hypothetical protein [Diaphorobacter sp. J5-51]